MRTPVSYCVLVGIYASLMVCARAEKPRQLTLSGDRGRQGGPDADNFIRLYLDRSSPLLSSLVPSGSSSVFGAPSTSSSTGKNTAQNENLQELLGYVKPNLNWVKSSKHQPSLLSRAAYYQTARLKPENNPTHFPLSSRTSNDIEKAIYLQNMFPNLLDKTSNTKENSVNLQDIPIPNLPSSQKVSNPLDIVPSLSTPQITPNEPRDLLVLKTKEDLDDGQFKLFRCQETALKQQSFVQLEANGKLSNEGSKAKIFAGRDAHIKKHPYQLQLGENGLQHCSASIISKRWAISAAQCLFDVDGRRRPDAHLTLRAGAALTNTGGALHRVERSVVHGQFDNSGRAFDYDIALLKVSEPFEFSGKVQPIHLPKKDCPVNDGKIVVVSGWGEKTGYGKTNHTRLREAQLRTVDHKTCSYLFEVPITPHMICARDEKKRICQDDVGGPLTRGKLLLGITCIASRQCNSVAVPSVATSVSAFRDWIKKNSGV